jgi:hypothetical protein
LPTRASKPALGKDLFPFRLLAMSDTAGITLRRLYPHLNERDIKTAEENLDRYLELALRVYERIRQDPLAYTNFQVLTSSKSPLKLSHKGSS